MTGWVLFNPYSLFCFQRWRSLIPSHAWTSGTRPSSCASRRPSRATKAIWNEGSHKRCGTEGRIHHACFHPRNDTNLHLTVSGDDRWWHQVFKLLTAIPSDDLILAFLPSLSECKSSRPHLCPEVCCIFYCWNLPCRISQVSCIETGVSVDKPCMFYTII